MDIDPIGILLVKSDSKGHRLLFRYPYLNENDSTIKPKFSRNTPYSLHIAEDILYDPNIAQNEGEKLTEFSDELLSTLFAVKTNFSDHKFELKINNIRFVGHPTFIQQRSKLKPCQNKVESPLNILVHVVFALKATAEYSVVKCYYDLSKRIGVAIRHEEKRCGYFGKEMKLMMTTHDMVSRYFLIIGRILKSEMMYLQFIMYFHFYSLPDGAHKDAHSSFNRILSDCSLARNLKSVYESLCSTGKVHFRLNDWIEVSFCLTQKAHSIYIPNFAISPEDIDRFAYPLN